MQKKVIWIFEIYLTISFLLYLFGPIKFTQINTIEVCSYILLYQLLFFIGYQFGKKNVNIYPRFSYKIGNSINTDLIIGILLLISCLFAFLSIFTIIGIPTPANVLSSIRNSINNAGDVYSSTLEASKNSSSSSMTMLITIFSPITYGIIPYSIYFFKKLPSFSKSLAIFAIILNIVAFFITGTNIGTFRIILTFLSVLMLKFHRSEKRIFNKRFFIGASALLLLFIFILVFSNNVSSRMVDMRFTISGFRIDFNNLFIRYLPNDLKLTLIFIVFYISQGYYGFSLALNYPWEPTYFLGGSKFIMVKSEALGFNSTDIFERTYISKMSGLWSPEVNWHTAYTWIANDMSPIGVAIYMFFLGFLMSLILRKAILEDITSIVLLPLTFMIVIFLPMNNNILGNPLTFIPFATFLFFFLLNNKITFVRSK